MAQAKPQVKTVSKVCLVDTITIEGVQLRGVKGKKVDVPENLIAVLERHQFIEPSTGVNSNEPVS